MVKVIHWPWSKVIQIQHFQTSFPEKPLGRLKSNLWQLGPNMCILGPNGIEEQKFVKIVQVTWPRWPPCLYTWKTWKMFLLWNQKAFDVESLYAALVTGVLPSLFKWWPLVDLDLFYGDVKFGPLCLCMGKKLRQWILQKLVPSMM